MKQPNPKKYGIVIDAARCIDCKACMIACKVENNVPEGFWRNWIRPLWSRDADLKTEFQPGQCMQCDGPSCVQACPVHLNPSQLGILAKNAEYELMAEEYHLMDCFECGSCSYVCPSHIPLVQRFRFSKAIVRERIAADG